MDYRPASSQRKGGIGINRIPAATKASLDSLIDSSQTSERNRTLSRYKSYDIQGNLTGLISNKNQKRCGRIKWSNVEQSTPSKRGVVKTLALSE